MTAVNVDGVVFGLRAALPALRRRGGGAVVVTASLAGLAPAPATPVYALTKAAVVQLVRSMAPPLAVEGVRLTALCPGFVETPLLDGMVERFDEAGFPLLTAEEVARGRRRPARRRASRVRASSCSPAASRRRTRSAACPGPRGLAEGVRPPTRNAVPAAEVPGAPPAAPSA